MLRVDFDAHPLAFDNVLGSQHAFCSLAGIEMKSTSELKGSDSAFVDRSCVSQHTHSARKRNMQEANARNLKE
jgi:hypothetical protein